MKMKNIIVGLILCVTQVCFAVENGALFYVCNVVKLVW